MGMFNGKGKKKKEIEPETETITSNVSISEPRKAHEAPPVELPELPSPSKGVVPPKDVQELIERLKPYGGLFSREDFTPQGTLADVCTLLVAQIDGMHRQNTIIIETLGRIESILWKALEDSSSNNG